MYGTPVFCTYPRPFRISVAVVAVYCQPGMSSGGLENRRRRRRRRKPGTELTPAELQAFFDEIDEVLLREAQRELVQCSVKGDSVPNEQHSDAECQQDLFDSIVRQMEFYFSDDNLPTDNFLLNQINSNDGGYVPLSILSNFPKIKELTKELDIIKKALESSSTLELSGDGVRRKDFILTRTEGDSKVKNLDDVRSRTILVTALPWENPRIEDVINHFETPLAPVKTAWLKKATEEEPLLIKRQLSRIRQNGKDELYALVEFETIEGMASAMSQVSWRSTPHVEALRPYFLRKKSEAVNSNKIVSSKKKDEQKKDETSVRPTFAWAATSKNKNDKGNCDSQNESLAESLSSLDVSCQQVVRKPAMPRVGCKGFGLGRGKIDLPFSL